MANFNTHLSVAAAVSTASALLTVDVHLMAYEDLPGLIFLGILGGMLPDIDASNSKPVKLLFCVLAFMAVAAVLNALKDSYAPYPLALVVVGTYLAIRHVLFALFNRLTVHRGVFHSVLAAIFFALLMTCISDRLMHWDALHAWANGSFIALGFLVHLLLDELFSVDLFNARMKKSFGTALKLFSYGNLSASALMAICTALLFWMAPTPAPLLKNLKAVHWHLNLAPFKLKSPK